MFNTVISNARKHITPIKILFVFSLVFQLSTAQQESNNTIKNTKSFPSEDYKSITFNGIWCWFSDPRAVYHEGKHKRTYAGWVDNYGDIYIAYYDHDTQKIASHVLYDNLEIDDHNNPSILFDAKGHLIVFFNTHLQDEQPLFMVKSKFPERIDHWLPVKELFLNDKNSYKDAKSLNYTYTNPVRLASENGKIFLFWRGVNLKPTYSFSTDNGETWSPGKILFLPKENLSLKTPYTKVFSDGGSKIHFTFTNGHPGKAPTTSIYYMYYEHGSFYKASGEKISDLDHLPVLEAELDLIYDGKTEQSSAWNWDIAQDKKGNPVIVYAKFPDTKNHIYTYSTWINNKWEHNDIVNSGGWFPKTPKNKIEPAPNYSGGITIDHESTNTLYLSIKRYGIFEIEKWITLNHGKSWEITKVTSNSTMDNVRPFAVRGALKENPLQVMWVQNTNYIYYATDTRAANYSLPFKDRFQTAIKSNLIKKHYKASLKKETLLGLTQQLLDWQLEQNLGELEYLKRSYGQFFAAIESYYKLTSKDRYKNELRNVLQYERNEDEDLEIDDFEDVFWLYTLKENRSLLERLENLSFKNIEDIDVTIILSGLANIVPKLNNDQIDKAFIKKTFITFSEKVLLEKQTKGFWKANALTKTPLSKLERTALNIYGLAWGIENGWIENSHKKQLETSLLALLELISKYEYKNANIKNNTWNLQTTAACILAISEMYTLLYKD